MHLPLHLRKKGKKNLRHEEFKVNWICSSRTQSAIHNAVLYYNLMNANAVSDDEPATKENQQRRKWKLASTFGSARLPRCLVRLLFFHVDRIRKNVLAIYEDIERMSTPLRNRIRVTFARLISSIFRVMSSTLKSQKSRGSLKKVLTYLCQKKTIKLVDITTSIFYQRQHKHIKISIVSLIEKNWN